MAYSTTVSRKRLKLRDSQKTEQTWSLQGKMKLRKIRTQLLPGVTLCQKDGIGLLAILVERDGLLRCAAGVCSREGIRGKRARRRAVGVGDHRGYGTLAYPEVAAAWFPEVADLPYMTDMDYVGRGGSGR